MAARTTYRYPFPHSTSPPAHSTTLKSTCISTSVPPPFSNQPAWSPHPFPPTRLLTFLVFFFLFCSVITFVSIQLSFLLSFRLFFNFYVRVPHLHSARLTLLFLGFLAFCCVLVSFVSIVRLLRCLGLSLFWVLFGACSRR